MVAEVQIQTNMVIESRPIAEVMQHEHGKALANIRKLRFHGLRALSNLCAKSYIACRNGGGSIKICNAQTTIRSIDSGHLIYAIFFPTKQPRTIAKYLSHLNQNFLLPCRS
jgi:hypothetical protein